MIGTFIFLAAIIYWGKSRLERAKNPYFKTDKALAKLSHPFQKRMTNYTSLPSHIIRLYTVLIVEIFRNFPGLQSFERFETTYGLNQINSNAAAHFFVGNMFKQGFPIQSYSRFLILTELETALTASLGPLQDQETINQISYYIRKIAAKTDLLSNESFGGLIADSIEFINSLNPDTQVDPNNTVEKVAHNITRVFIGENFAVNGTKPQNISEYINKIAAINEWLNTQRQTSQHDTSAVEKFLASQQYFLPSQAAAQAKAQRDIEKLFIAEQKNKGNQFFSYSEKVIYPQPQTVTPPTPQPQSSQTDQKAASEEIDRILTEIESHENPVNTLYNSLE